MMASPWLGHVDVAFVPPPPPCLPPPRRPVIVGGSLAIGVVIVKVAGLLTGLSTWRDSMGGGLFIDVAGGGWHVD